MLARGPALPASASAVARVLDEAGYELVEEATWSHPDKVHRFERAEANQLWLMWSPGICGFIARPGVLTLWGRSGLVGFSPL